MGCKTQHIHTYIHIYIKQPPQNYGQFPQDEMKQQNLIGHTTPCTADGIRMGVSYANRAFPMEDMGLRPQGPAPMF